jgi:predicted regulator of Ras-like GTPase activity (Roadblock/LC7/MglB family)
VSGTNRHDFATLLREALLAEGAPQRILHLISGIEQPDSPPGSAGEPHTRVARLVSLLFFEENRALEEVQTGNLIRLVVEGEHGAIYCLAVQRNRHLVGVLTADATPEAVDAADRVMARLVDAVRRSIGLNSQNPAGFTSFPGDDVVDAQYGNHQSEDHYSGVPPIATVRGPDVDPVQRELLLNMIAPDAVQWAALVHGREVRVAVDCFADARMDEFFVLMGQDARRRFYSDFAGSGCMLLNRVSRLVRPALGGRVRRIVLDVEEGTVVLHRLGPQAHLMGVTLNQERVAVVERLLRRAAAALDAVPTP